MEFKAFFSIVILSAALVYAFPQSSNHTIADANTTHPMAPTNTTSVFPMPSKAPTTSNAEFRVFLSFLVFGAVAAATLLLYPLVLFALDLRSKKRASSDSTDS
jgi:hypothetical protein